MIESTLDASVVDWVIEHPETMKLFESLGIDCSCAGKSLEFACRQEGLDPHYVLARIQELLASQGSTPAGGSSAGGS
jgi:regulator of cell morphogenesis and NO signaling